MVTGLCDVPKESPSSSPPPAAISIPPPTSLYFSRTTECFSDFSTSSPLMPSTFPALFSSATVTPTNGSSIFMYTVCSCLEHTASYTFLSTICSSSFHSNSSPSFPPHSKVSSASSPPMLSIFPTIFASYLFAPISSSITGAT